MIKFHEDLEKEIQNIIDISIRNIRILSTNSIYIRNEVKNIFSILSQSK